MDPARKSLESAFITDVNGLHHNLPYECLNYGANISLMHKYIYIETAKCGCSTIKLTLQRLELGDVNYKRDDFEEIHVREYSPLLTPRQVGSFRNLLNRPDYIKFCFVRNPYTRLLSAYLDKFVRQEYDPQPLAGTWVVRQRPEGSHQLLRVCACRA
jgi:sulfotransferase famil protein